jgi:DNA adenine methylase
MSVSSSVNSEISRKIEVKAKPFVKWVGGKRQLLKQYRELGVYPPQDFDARKSTYHEPFVGGGAVFFDLVPHTAELSDMNNELVTTYNVIRDNTEELIRELTTEAYVYDKGVFLEHRAKQPAELSDIETAARFIYLNRTAFNGMYRVNKSGGFNVPFGRYSSPQICDKTNIRAVASALAKVKVHHRDFKVVLDRARSGDFVYFDPPYYPVSKTSSFTTYTKDAFLDKEQIELRNAFLELHNRGCFVMLSNSDTPFINDLFKPLQKEGITTHKVQAGRAINSNAGKRGKVCEVLVTNY